MNSRRAWLVWSVGVFAYIAAVTQRTTMGVAGLAATERFDITAATLSAFSVVQLMVYAGLQIPVGVLVDRFGARLLICLGAVLMGGGQLQLAFAVDVPGGILGRVLVGAGDAMTFISVLRLIPPWFESRRVPMITQWTGMLGQLGQVVSAVPFVLLLNAAGWSTALTAVASLSLLALVLVAAAVRNYPAGSEHRPRPSTWLQTGISVMDAWKQPGTRLGMWSHFTVQFSGNVFIFAWGYPFLVSAQGVDPAVASVCMTLFVGVILLTGPLFGRFASRHPLRRTTAMLLVTACTALVWAAVLLYPGPAPLWLLIVLVVVLAIGGPGSMVGFDIARTFNPAHRMGTATGIVNVGGFFAALASMFLIGLILDVLNGVGFSGGNLYALDSFRIALSVQFLFWAVGAYGILSSRRLVRARLADQGIVVPPLREALARDRRRRAVRRRSAPD